MSFDSRADLPILSSDPDSETLIRTCPNCGLVLIESRCKLICPDPVCGYHLSCSDYL